MSFSVSPGFLMAMPGLADPNFFRSVVLMCSHTAEGAFGLVINQPSDVTVQSVCGEASVDWSGEPDVSAFIGGPVEQARGWILHTPDRTLDESEELAEGLRLSASRAALEAYGLSPEGRFRLFLGYAGWGAHQLDQEIARGSWLTAPLSIDLVFDTAPHLMWRHALALVGVDPANLVDGNTRLN